MWRGVVEESERDQRRADGRNGAERTVAISIEFCRVDSSSNTRGTRSRSDGRPSGRQSVGHTTVN